MPKLALCLVIAEVGGGGGGGDIGIWPQPPGGPGIDNTLPGGPPAHPWLPGMIGGGGGGRPDNTLPGGRPPHVGNWVPGSGPPPLPTHPIYRPDKPTPPGQSPGAGMWVIAYVPGKGLVWTPVTPGVPEKPQPPAGGGGPPPDPNVPDNTLPSVPVDPEAPTPAPTA